MFAALTDRPWYVTAVVIGRKRYRLPGALSDRFRAREGSARDTFCQALRASTPVTIPTKGARKSDKRRRSIADPVALVMPRDVHGSRHKHGTANRPHVGTGKVIFKSYMRDPLTILCLRKYVWGVQGAQYHHLSRTWDRTRAI